MQLTQQVNWILQNLEKTRDDDKALYYSVVWNFYKEAFIEYEPNQFAVKMSHIYQIPSFESVRRCRATIQNKEKLYLPLKPETIKKRMNHAKKISQSIVMHSQSIYDSM